MVYLSMQLGHNASISVFKDDQIITVISQEKFDNIKNSPAFPKEAIKYSLDVDKIPKVDRAIICGLTIYPAQMDMADVKKESNYKMNLLAKARKNAAKFLFKYNRGLLERIRSNMATNATKIAKQELVLKLRALGINPEIEFVEHHICHSFSPVAFYGLWKTKKPVLVMTLDGAGDKYCATVNIWDGKIMKRISSTPLESSLGYIYSKATIYMGMKALEHEYKVMGIASYSKKDYFMKTYDKIFKGMMWVNKSDLTFDSKISTNYFDDVLVKKAAYERFDNLASALQYFTEELVIEWVKAAVEKTQIKEIAFSGGVFMNVKLNKKIQEMPEIEKVYFMPSCGDESNVIGSIGYIAYKNKVEIKTLKDMYLGMGYTNREVESFIADKNLKKKYKVSYHKDIENITADLVARNNVVARFKGRNEWGARALGNRTIIANPSNIESFYKVNDQVKMRDFWMPFAPSILIENAPQYLKDWNKLKKKVQESSYYMITAFDCTPEAIESLRAAIHQGDKTCRPQVVTEENNPDYHRLIKLFKKKTGIGAVLNTSLNIHGYPLVGSLEQALFTYENSGLNYMTLENYLVAKN